MFKLIALGIVAISFISIASTAYPKGNQCSAISQLPCYCENEGLGRESIAGENNLVAPCYASSTQAASFSLFGFYSAFAWGAINWPLDVRRDLPDYKRKLQDVKSDTTVVWDSWKSAGDVFLLDGGKPSPWKDKSHRLPASCKAIDSNAVKAGFGELGRSIPDDLPEKFLTDYVNAEGDVLVDRNHALVWYQTLMNKPAYDYIVDNELYNTDGQDAFFANGGEVDYPAGTTANQKRGTIFLKAAWKVLEETEPYDTLHKAWAYIYPTFKEGTLISGCELKPVGLLGLHMTYKLGTATEFAWATFEHAMVAPDWDHVRNPDQEYKKGEFLLFERECTKQDGCAFPNTAPKLFPGHGKPPQRSQLVRQQDFGYGYTCYNPVCKGVSYINDTLVKELASSALGHYKLKGTQWVNIGRHNLIKPVVLANTAIEPYIQSTSSCLDCHMPAKVKFEAATGNLIPKAQPANNIFVLQRAKPRMKSD